MKNILARFVTDESGTTVVEYGLFQVEFFSLGSAASFRYPIANSVATSETTNDKA